ncbi:MAG: phosphohydrolase [Solobacterium sp.]|nr:phosphohydrolase [Solobacterium sp.]
MTFITGSKETFLNADHKEAMEFLMIVSDITAADAYAELKKYVHHKTTNRYQHCLNVAWYSYLWAKNAGLDYRSAARGAMLHDFYLYDTKEFRLSGMNHNIVHPRIALKNARMFFDVNPVMEDCIVHHMWPSGIGSPVTMEGAIVSAADKYCASLEWGLGRAGQIVPVIRAISRSIRN